MAITGFLAIHPKLARWTAVGANISNPALRARTFTRSYVADSLVLTTAVVVAVFANSTSRALTAMGQPTC